MQRNYLPLATYEPTNLYLFIILSCVSHWAHTRLVAHVMHSVPWSASTSRPTDPHSECLSVPMSAAAESKDRGTQWLWEGLVVVSGKSQDGFPIFPAFPWHELDLQTRSESGNLNGAEVCVRWISEANVVPSRWLQARAKEGTSERIWQYYKPLRSRAYAKELCKGRLLSELTWLCYYPLLLLLSYHYQSLSYHYHVIIVMLFTYYYHISAIFTKYYDHI